ncbi:MAG: glycosyltransferase [Steroidobacteraceae bacterium]
MSASAFEISSLSIVLCTFNRATMLRETLTCLASLEPAPGVRHEVVIVDNNSSDETQSVCREFETSATMPVACCVETAQGLSNARNRGLRQALGDVVVFTDDDIVVPSTWVRDYAAAYRRHDADAVFGKIIPDWGGPRPNWYHAKLGPIYGALDYGDFETVVRNRRQEFFGANFSVRRQLLAELGGFDPSLGRTPENLYISEERKIFLALASRGRKIVYSPAIQVRHRISDRMKARSYVRKYYRDTAVSLVNMTPRRTSRQLFGIPYYRAAECLASFLLFVPRQVQAICCGDYRALYPLRLELMRSFRVCWLHIRRRLAKDPGI